MSVTLDQLQAIMPRLPPEKAEEYLPHLNAAMEEFGIVAHHEYCDSRDRIIGGKPCNCPAPLRRFNAARMAAFLAQLAFESLDLTRWEEMSWTEHRCACRWRGRMKELVGDDGACPKCHRNDRLSTVRYPDCYEDRADLGNTEPGDGVRFKGRGPIQLTGRANYRAASLALFPGEPGRNGTQTYLEMRPEEVLRPDTGFRVAGWFWAGCSGERTSCNALANGISSARDSDDERRSFDRITRAINGGLRGADERWAYYLRAREVLGQPQGKEEGRKT